MFSQVKPTLAKLNEDADFDVRYFASEASVGMYLKFFEISWNLWQNFDLQAAYIQ